ncbi:hypothetical protein AcW1_000291 [Taiwanofungus camphoratus]|nr:hypothetical protein AcV7_000311 [Antrodia cinnamomea]KAI0963121.1 hypothetical protein AcW1_000291 [Antrodia cinnamomea]
MAQRSNQPLSNNPSGTANNPAGHRRARSASQPQPIPGPSNNRTVDPLDFSFLNQLAAGPSSAPIYSQAAYDEESFVRALRALQDVTPAFPSVPAAPPPPAPPLASVPGQHAPNPTEVFLAALPWLQFLQMQSQYTQQQQQQQQQHQQQQQQQHQHQQHVPYMPSPTQPQSPFSFGGGQPSSYTSNEAGGSQMLARSQPAEDTPSPEGAEPTEAEQASLTEEKRRRNTAASARFRIKKKQWTLNLERTITDLSGRVEELEREASELRRENGWLKEIVMLKSKRLTGAVPDLQQNTGAQSGGTRSPQSSGERGSRDSSAEGRPTGEEKGKRRQP